MLGDKLHLMSHGETSLCAAMVIVHSYHHDVGPSQVCRGEPSTMDVELLMRQMTMMTRYV